MQTQQVQWKREPCLEKFRLSFDLLGLVRRLTVHAASLHNCLCTSRSLQRRARTRRRAGHLLNRARNDERGYSKTQDKMQPHKDDGSREEEAVRTTRFLCFAAATANAELLVRSEAAILDSSRWRVRSADRPEALKLDCTSKNACCSFWLVGKRSSGWGTDLSSCAPSGLQIS